MREIYRTNLGNDDDLLLYQMDNGRYALLFEWTTRAAHDMIGKDAIEAIQWALWGLKDSTKGWAEGTDMAEFILGYFPESLVTLAALERS